MQMHEDNIQKMKHTVIVIGNSLKWSSHLKQSSFKKKTKKKTYVQIRFPLKRKTNLSLAPARLKLWETKRVLCQCLQQDHGARLATSRLEGIDFTTDLGIYFAVTMDWRDANGCPGTVLCHEKMSTLCMIRNWLPRLIAIILCSGLYHDTRTRIQVLLIIQHRVKQFDFVIALCRPFVFLTIVKWYKSMTTF